MSRRSHLTLSLPTLLLVAGCGFGAVKVEPHQPEPGTTTMCASLIEHLPKTVDDAVRRDVDPASQPVAAWGEPPIVLRCGVAMPAAYRPDATLYEVEGIGWLPEDGDGGMFFTAADREVLVEVAIPDDYAPEAGILVDLAPAILSTIPERGLP